MTQAHPLQWPAGWPRTESPERTSRYSVTFGRARKDLLHSLSLLGAINEVISTNMPVRRDGLPYATARNPDDAGVAVYWSIPQGGGLVPQVMACDRWTNVRDNLRAIGLAIDGLRAIERSGASEVLHRAYQGFAQLPSGIVTPVRRPWREVLGDCQDIEAVKRVHRGLVRDHHPDRGGDPDRFREIQQAYEDAMKELGA